MADIKQKRIDELKRQDSEISSSNVGNAFGINLSPEETDDNIKRVKSDLAFLKTREKRSFPIKQHVTAAPTYTPKNYNDQIVFYNSGVTYRVYFYVNNSWKYVTLS